MLIIIVMNETLYQLVYLWSIAAHRPPIVGRKFEPLINTFLIRFVRLFKKFEI